MFVCEEVMISSPRSGFWLVSFARSLFGVRGIPLSGHFAVWIEVGIVGWPVQRNIFSFKRAHFRGFRGDENPVIKHKFFILTGDPR